MFSRLNCKLNRPVRVYRSTNIAFDRLNQNCRQRVAACSVFVVGEYDIVEMAASGFNVSSRTVIMISGFLSDDHSDWMERSKDTWLQLDPDVDVILVSWKDSNRYIYSKAVAVTPLVARQVTIFFHYLAEINGKRLNSEKFAENIHFVGHSLGAHIGGFVGQDLGGKMGRITGLDPAGPSFDTGKREHRLDRSDAKLVVELHESDGQ